VIQAGFVRATEAIDLLVEASPGNVQRVRRALAMLPDGAARDLADDDVERYTVVRVADEVVVDLIGSACGVTYEAAKDAVEHVIIDEVSIPFATPDLLWRTKQSVRDKDVLDRTTGRNRGRGAARRRTSSCCRRARFSRTRLGLGWKAANQIEPRR
jgi:hypothetical protein